MNKPLSDFFLRANQELAALKEASKKWSGRAYAVERVEQPTSLPRRINTFGQADSIIRRIPEHRLHYLDARINFWAAADCYILLVKTPHVRRATESFHNHRWIPLDSTDEQIIDHLLEMAVIVHNLETAAS